MKSEKAKTVFKNESSMQVNNEKATMMAKIDHNEASGTIKITYTLTTRHLSFNEDIQSQVASELAKLHAKVYGDAIDVHKHWIEEQNNIEGAAKIPFPGEAEDLDKLPFGDGEQAIDDEEEPKTTGKGKKTRGSKVTVK